MRRTTTRNPRGYIALMATIIISLVLLGMVAQESFPAGLRAFVALGGEAHAQAASLAEGCADEALAALTEDAGVCGQCTPSAVWFCGCERLSYRYDRARYPQAGQATITTQASVRGSYATIQTVLQLSPMVVIPGAKSRLRGNKTALAARERGIVACGPLVFNWHVIIRMQHSFFKKSQRGFTLIEILIVIGIIAILGGDRYHRHQSGKAVCASARYAARRSGQYYS